MKTQALIAELQFSYYQAPCAVLKLGYTAEALHELIWQNDFTDLDEDFQKADVYDDSTQHVETAQALSAMRGLIFTQLDEYFAGQRRSFDLSLSYAGTAFQMRVWEALQRIPYGETCSYGQLAASINSPRAYRAVGGANHHNRIAIVIPCHRVIAASRAMGGYAGGVDRKAFLLALESADL